MASKNKNQVEIIENKDPWGINETLMKSTTQIQSVLSYSPLYDAQNNFILVLEFTKKYVYVLLKNGTVIKFGGEQFQSANTNIEEIYQSAEHPQYLALPTKIIDISCGFEHTLAKGRDCRIYSWGSNSYGQLGLENWEIGKIELNDPDYIPKFLQWKIVQIYAINYNSFCIADDNTIFGFGQIKSPGESKISIPEKMQSINSLSKDFQIFINKKGNNLYISHLNVPKKTFITSLEARRNRQEYNEEYKHKTEIKQLKEELNEMTKVRTTSNDFKQLINHIQKLIIKYEEKGNNRQLTKRNVREELDPVKNYEKQIEFFQIKKNKLNANVFIDYFSDLDGKFLSNHPIDLHEEVDIQKKDNLLLFNNHLPQFSSLLERVSSELQVQKFHFLENYNKDNELQKTYYKKNKENNELVSLFKQIIEEIENKIDHVLDKDTYEETENIKGKCSQEFQNFMRNTLDEITVANVDLQQCEQLTLKDFMKKSSDNLQKLSEKMRNLQIHSFSNKLGRTVLDMFNKNILLAHQNNYLMSFILNNLVTPVFHNSAEKALNYINPIDFKDTKSIVDLLKHLHNEKDDQKISVVGSKNNAGSVKGNTNNNDVNQSQLESDDELN